jgi:succinoglycan biosynthesis protein ExoA
MMDDLRGDDVGEGMVKDTEFVSVVIPCRNEEEFIGNCLESLVTNDYPKDRLEILVVDGSSEDRTRAIVQGFAERFPFIRLVENLRKITPAALNRGIEEMKGDIFMRIDAHASYPRDYVSKCLLHLRAHSADNVGGVIRTEPRINTLTSKAIAYCMSHRFGSGTATFRSGSSTSRWTDTVFGGCYRKEIFRKVGRFDERLVKTQDREFNQRLRDAGGKILVVPEIRCTYFARSGLVEFSRYMFQAGLWPFFGSRLCGRRFYSLRNFVPLVFLLSLIGTLTASLFFPVAWWLLAAIGSVYGIAAIASSLSLIKKEGDLRYIIVVPLVFAVTHLLYGIGSVAGILKPVSRADPQGQAALDSKR